MLQVPDLQGMHANSNITWQSFVARVLQPVGFLTLRFTSWKQLYTAGNKPAMAKAVKCMKAEKGVVAMKSMNAMKYMKTAKPMKTMKTMKAMKSMKAMKTMKTTMKPAKAMKAMKIRPSDHIAGTIIWWWDARFARYDKPEYGGGVMFQ